MKRKPRPSLISTLVAAPLITPAGSSTAPVSEAPTLFSNLGNQGLAILLLLAGVVAVFYMVWAGIQYIQSAGDATKAKTARAALMNAFIGVIIVLAAFLIVQFAQSIVNSLGRLIP